jgi:cytochrome d ubiquinol oxidase subunit I
VIKHDPKGLFPGLTDFPRNERPPVFPVFVAFRVMVAVGMVLIASGLVGLWLWWRGRLFDTRWYLRLVAPMWPLGFVGIVTGWIVTEVGRQPWIATGILRTANAISPVPASSVAVSLLAFVLVYTVVFGVGIVYVRRLLRRGPVAPAHGPEGALPNRPLAAAQAAVHEGTLDGGH